MKKKIKIGLLLIAAVLILFALSIGRTFTGNILKGNVHFPNEHIGEILLMKDGQKYTVFRRLQVHRDNNETVNPAVFTVRFKFSGLEPAANKRLSMIPAPFLMGMKDFREKYWTFDETTGFFQGIYQWESIESAEDYPNSFIFGLMTKRSAPGTLSYEVMPNTRLSEYIEKLLSESNPDNALLQ